MWHLRPQEEGSRILKFGTEELKSWAQQLAYVCVCGLPAVIRLLPSRVPGHGEAEFC